MEKNEAYNFLFSAVNKYFEIRNENVKNGIAAKDFFNILQDMFLKNHSGKISDHTKQKIQDVADLATCSFYWNLRETDSIDKVAIIVENIIANEPDLLDMITSLLKDLNRESQNQEVTEKNFLYEKTKDVINKSSDDKKPNIEENNFMEQK